MIRDLNQGRPLDPGHFDVCIVGAGAAGIVLAVELVSQGKRVLMLEGGGGDVEDSAQEPYQSEVVGLRHNGVHLGRFRAKGGTTTRWGGQILELDDLDFEKRSWIEGSGWPIAKSELKQYYSRALKQEGMEKVTLEDAEVWREIKQAPPAFPDLEPFFTRWCPEPNFAYLHQALLEKSEAIEVWLHANAVELVREGPKVVGVCAKTQTGIDAVFVADRYVFCLGGIESSRFFLQPETQQKPWNDSGLLGRHFQDHIICNGAMLEPLQPSGFHNLFDNVFLGRFKYQPKLRLARDRQIAEKTLNVAAMFMFYGDSDAIGAELKSTVKKVLRGRWKESTSEELIRLIRYSPLLARQIYRYSVDHRAYVPRNARIELGVHCEQEPESKSSITLSDERDSLGLLRTRLDWQISDREIASIRTYVETAQRAFAGVVRVIPNEDLMNDPDQFRKTCGDNYHHMGGMRMASSRMEGVVDLDLRLHGMENAYVCSSAVFPTSGFSNPTHTLLALAVRLADHLKTQ